MKTYTACLNSLMVVLFVLLVAFLAMGKSVQDWGDYHEYHEPTKVERMFMSGECWTGGEGHPFPTRIVINNQVRHMTGPMFDNAMMGKYHFQGFCK